jgi:hypothetical protein
MAEYNRSVAEITVLPARLLKSNSRSPYRRSPLAVDQTEIPSLSYAVVGWVSLIQRSAAAMNSTVWPFAAPTHTAIAKPIENNK